jgi:acylphosphatase
MIRRTAVYRGTVQGVGFRWTVLRVAAGYRVTGTVRNLPDGTVELVAEGEASEVAGLLAAVADRMRHEIREADLAESPATGEFATFTVTH